MTVLDRAGPRTPPKVPRPGGAPLTHGRVVRALRRRLAVLAVSELSPGERAARVDATVEELWQRVGSDAPVVEPVPGAPDERVVTFLWRDARAAEVLLFVNRLTDERTLPRSLMRHVPGTDVWHLSYRVRSGWRASYGYVPRLPDEPWPWTPDDQVAVRHGLDRALADPRNPRTSRNRPGTALSVVELPDAPAQPWLDPRPGVARGVCEVHDGPDGRTVWVHRPVSAPAGPLPVVVLLDGDVWTGTQDAGTTLDNLWHDGLVRPCVLVMPDAGGRDRRWAELDADGAGSDWVVERLLPWARERWPLSTDPADVVVAGQSLGGYTALRTVVRHPDRVGAALSQSASLWQRDPLTGPGPGGAAGRLDGVRAYVEVGQQEWVLREPNRRTGQRLAAAGAQVTYVEYDGGHDYACWRGGLADGLRALLPAR